MLTHNQIMWWIYEPLVLIIVMHQTTNEVKPEFVENHMTGQHYLYFY